MLLKLRHLLCLALAPGSLVVVWAADPDRSGSGTGPLRAVEADRPPAPDAEQFLLLRNGEVISGRIERLGDHYDVTQRDGEIHVRAGEVEAVCKDLDACYQIRRSRVSNGSAADYIALADWCLRRRMLEQAQASLAEATAADPTHPKLALLRRRLELVESDPPSRAPAGERNDDHASPEELDRASRSLPPRSMELFTNSIQPLLLNHCATAGCHGPQSPSAFHLMRLPSNRAASRRSTQRNLVATLSIVDREHPAASRLLTAPAGPHGTTTSAIFAGRKSHQYLQLVEWVSLVSGQEIESLIADAADTPPAPLPAAARPAKPIAATGAEKRPARGSAAAERDSAAAEPAGSPGSSGVERASFTQPLHVTPWPAASGAAPTDRPAPSRITKPPQRGAPRKEFAPVDEFDPEIFNRSAAGSP